MKRTRVAGDAIRRVEAAIAALAAGRMVIVEDDEDRENEGDFILPSDTVTPEAVNFMAIHGRGLICQAVTRTRAVDLALTPMASDNTSSHDTAFTVSVDARDGATTGISAADRATTIRLVASAATSPDELRRPGHVFPLVAKPGGVLQRRGHTEAAVDLARLAGFTPSGVLCEIADADGSMARHDELQRIAEGHGLVLISIADLVVYRKARDRITVRRLGEAMLPTERGEFRVIAYHNPSDPWREPVALVRQLEEGLAPPLVRVHSECLTGEVFGSKRCDCAAQLDAALRRIGQEGGVVVYLRQEGRGIGLGNKIRAYGLQDGGMDTVEANEHIGCRGDARDYRIAAEILRDLGITSIRLITNNPQKIEGLSRAGIVVTERIEIAVSLSEESIRYMRTKKEKLGHLYDDSTLARIDHRTEAKTTTEAHHAAGN